MRGIPCEREIVKVVKDEVNENPTIQSGKIVTQGLRK
jgi:hypothetical protein